ncbi:O-antigen ligase family protein [Kosakonia sp.]|uniref:O-antigen ligase family protein n=1 Tax=Kosakonia sp. TaxID=1916651 RepID=UPI00289E0DC6|nr:O-antigen ligase family protein [Kosakonia sp.]
MEKPATMANIEKYVYLLAFALLVLVLPTGFLHEKTARILFYWSGYLSATGLLLNLAMKQWTRDKNALARLFMLLTLLFAVWSALSSWISHDPSSELLFTPAKRWFIASAIACYLISFNRHLPADTLRKTTLAAMTVAFVAASAYGIYQGITTQDRIFLGINRATLTAYAYSAFALAYSSLLISTLQHRAKYVLQALLLIISTYVVILTQTRAAIVIHPLLGLMLLAVSMYKDKLLSVKIILAACIALVAVVAVNHKMLTARLDSTLQDIQAYNNGWDYTSLGARFSMWKVGIVAFKESPLGQSESHRNNAITQYLAEKNIKSNAADYLTIHLHNEFIQYASLFGVFGILILAFFYYSLICKISTPKVVGPVALASFSALLYGATDVVLTSIEYVVILSTTLTLSYLVMAHRK